jgi:hypothetical protein
MAAKVKLRRGNPFYQLCATSTLPVAMGGSGDLQPIARK